MKINLDALRIVHYPHAVLKQVAEPVTDFGPELEALTQRMLVLMRDNDGVGLAAPQVGLALRLFVCNVTGEPEGDFVVVNPRFTERDGVAEMAEGCLSLPGVTVTKRRATRVVLEGQDAQGQAFRREGADLAARVWQHEADHLDGRLLIDQMSEADEIANRRAVKQMKERAGKPSARV